MRREGFEPSRPCGQWILSPSCLPFHHRRARASLGPGAATSEPATLLRSRPTTAAYPGPVDSELEQRIPVQLRWRDMDMLGHLNQSVYHELLEEGRADRKSTR